MAAEAQAQRGRPFTKEQLPKEGRTELGLAAAIGDRDEVSRIMQEGASASEQDAYLDTPLHLACLFGRLDVVKVLLKEKAVKIDPVNAEGWTPLCCAVSRGHLSIVKYLLRCQANGNWMTPLGWQLMHIAAWNNQHNVVEWLAEHGAQTAAETVHAARPFDMTRPGPTRRAVFEAMQEERRSSMLPVARSAAYG